MIKKLLLLILLLLLFKGCDSFFTDNPDRFVFGPAPKVTGSPGAGSDGKDCRYTVDSTKRVGVTIRTDEGYLRNFYEDRGANGKDFVLIKEDARISCVKMWNKEGGADRLGGEMIKIGTTKTISGFTSPDPSEDVYLARGHCYSTEGACRDPLTIQTIFVLKKAGAMSDETCPRDTASQLEKESKGYWWTFDVYLDKSYFKDADNDGIIDDPGEINSGGVPDWIGGCKTYIDGRVDLGAQGRVAGASTDFPRILNAAEIIFSPSRPAKMTDFYLYRETGSSLTSDWGEIGSYNSWKVSLDKGSEGTNLALKQAEDNYYFYNAISGISSENNKSLHLGSFVPTGTGGSAYYQWWTPSCKPALYFYPEKPTELSVIVRPKGKITQSIPDHKDGWQIMAYPDGKVVELSSKKEFPYLYYEAEIEKMKTPPEGFIVKKEDLTNFFQRVLPLTGLKGREITDFLEYWQPKLSSEGENWFIGLVAEAEVNRLEPVKFSVKPDNFLRVRFFFEKIIGQKSGLIVYGRETATKALKEKLGIYLTHFSRKGFTVVDWGGVIENGTCGGVEKSQ